eukprot:58023_1
MKCYQKAMIEVIRDRIRNFVLKIRFSSHNGTCFQQHRCQWLRHGIASEYITDKSGTQFKPNARVNSQRCQVKIPTNQPASCRPNDTYITTANDSNYKNHGIISCKEWKRQTPKD